MNLTKSLKNVRDVEKEVLKIIENPLKNIPTFEKAIFLSKKYNIDLHPKYTLYFNEISCVDLILFLENLKKIKVINENEVFKIELLNKNEENKIIFENLGIEHKLTFVKFEELKNQNSIILIDEINSKSLLAHLGIYEIENFNMNIFLKKINEIIEYSKKNLGLSSIEILNNFLKIKIRDKGGTYIGCRMGRPEKAKPRDGFKIDGRVERPHGLFPVGEEGGRNKNIITAYQDFGYVNTECRVFKNDKNELKIFDDKTSQNIFYDKYSGIEIDDKVNGVKYKKHKIDMKKELKFVKKVLKKEELPKLVKGVSKLLSKTKVCENISKGFLREKNGVKVNKDGSIRYDMIEMGLTHFKPKEIETSVSKLIELGYTTDKYGNKLENDNQIIEIFPQDVILPDCSYGEEKKASEFIIGVGNFVDDCLEKLYGLEKFYNFKNRDDTIGHLIVGLAPHTSAGIIGRIIGYSKTQGCFSHPMWHAAQRRNLDGDENGIILLMDSLINFSKHYLPNRRGSKTMDTPLVLTTHLYLDQIDDEVHGMDIVENYDLEFYKSAKKQLPPKEINVEKISSKLKIKFSDKQYFGYEYTHDVENMNDTILYSAYKDIPLMNDKVGKQLHLSNIIRAVNEDKSADLIIDKHFLKDIKGNLRKFGMQKFRCPLCNQSYRRPPLNNKCIKCEKSNIIFTISEGSIKKYLDTSFKIIEKYNVNPYLVETLDLTKLRIEGVFGDMKKKQKKLKEFF